MPNRKPLALVLEDDASAGEALAFLLRDWGAEVALAENADALVSQLGPRVAQARWIIADYHLGPSSMDGVATARLITADAPAARVLVLTGSVSDEAARAAARAGFEIMRKPAPPETILAWLERA